MNNDLFSLDGKVAIITGGNGGIGLGMARGLAAARASIILAGRNEAKTATAVKDLRLAVDTGVIGLKVDVSDETSVQAMAAAATSEFGRIDILVNNAGIAIAWASANIQVNAILPGWIHTELTAGIKERLARYAGIRARIPFGRWGEPDELAGAAVFLASAASDFVTGISLPVDGGYGIS